MHRKIAMDLFASDHPGPSTGGSTAAEPGRPPPPARAPRAGGADLDDWPREPPRARPWLLVAAIVPWVVVAAMLLLGPQAPTAPDSTVPGPVPTDAGSTVPRSAPADAEPPTPTPVPPEGPSGAVLGRHQPSGADARTAAVGLAVAAARAWLSTQPTRADVEGLDHDPLSADTYVEHLAVESIDQPARGAAVVTLLGLVLPVEEDRYGTPQQVRVAVPVRLDAAGPHLAGAPWRLEPHDLRLEPMAGVPVDDPDLALAAADAVGQAGYDAVSLVRLERTDGWPLVAHVDAKAPGHDRVARHVIWLRADVGRLVVAGSHAGDRAAESGAGPPPSTPTATPSEAAT